MWTNRPLQPPWSLPLPHPPHPLLHHHLRAPFSGGTSFSWGRWGEVVRCGVPLVFTLCGLYCCCCCMLLPLVLLFWMLCELVLEPLWLLCFVHVLDGTCLLTLHSLGRCPIGNCASGTMEGRRGGSEDDQSPARCLCTPQRSLCPQVAAASKHSASVWVSGAELDSVVPPTAVSSRCCVRCLFAVRARRYCTFPELAVVMEYVSWGT